jgi:Mrp family chromosome partitioning ATPase
MKIANGSQPQSEGLIVTSRVEPVRHANHIQPNREFRALASRMLSLRENPEHHKTIGIASCSHNEGNTTLAGNLAVAINDAVDGEVLLVDCAEPKKSSRMRSPGWFELVFGRGSLSELVQATDCPKLSVISSGQIDAKGFTYNRDRLTHIVQELKDRFEFVIMDLPCADDLSGCIPIASVLDGVIFNLKAGIHNSQQASRILHEFKSQGANVLGVVLNQTQSHVPSLLRMFL